MLVYSFMFTVTADALFGDASDISTEDEGGADKASERSRSRSRSQSGRSRSRSPQDARRSGDEARPSGDEVCCYYRFTSIFKSIMGSVLDRWPTFHCLSKFLFISIEALQAILTRRFFGCTVPRGYTETPWILFKIIVLYYSFQQHIYIRTIMG